MKDMSREVQLKLLNLAAESYPETIPDDVWQSFVQREPRAAFNVVYLSEHELLQVRLARSLGMSAADALHSVGITAKGLDFLQDDGGLSAILNVVTVRLDADTLRALIEDKIDATPMPPEEKSKLMKWVKSAGSEALSEATKRLVGAALDQAPDVLPLLRTLLSSTASS